MLTCGSFERRRWFKSWNKNLVHTWKNQYLCTLELYIEFQDNNDNSRFVRQKKMVQVLRQNSSTLGKNFIDRPSCSTVENDSNLGENTEITIKLLSFSFIKLSLNLKLHFNLSLAFEFHDLAQLNPMFTQTYNTAVKRCNGSLGALCRGGRKLLREEAERETRQFSLCRGVGPRGRLTGATAADIPSSIG